MTLPRIDDATADRVRALVAAGPPTETVGVTEVLPFPSTPVSPAARAALEPDVLSAVARNASRKARS